MNGSRGPVCEHLVTGLWVREINILLESSEVLSGKEFCLILLLSFSEKPALGGATSSVFPLETAAIEDAVD